MNSIGGGTDKAAPKYIEIVVAVADKGRTLDTFSSQSRIASCR
jgi:hypothetical protein